MSESTVSAFEDYAAVVFERFAGRVTLWSTFNEPHTFVRQGYSEGNMAPGRCSDLSKCDGGDSFSEPYVAAHNILRAHAAAVARFRSAASHLPGVSKIGMVLNGEWAEPPARAGGEPSDADKDAAQR